MARGTSPRFRFFRMPRPPPSSAEPDFDISDISDQHDPDDTERSGDRTEHRQAHEEALEPVHHRLPLSRASQGGLDMLHSRRGRRWPDFLEAAPATHEYLGVIRVEPHSLRLIGTSCGRPVPVAGGHRGWLPSGRIGRSMRQSRHTTSMRASTISNVQASYTLHPAKGVDPSHNAVAARGARAPSEASVSQARARRCDDRPGASIRSEQGCAGRAGATGVATPCQAHIPATPGSDVYHRLLSLHGAPSRGAGSCLPHAGGGRASNVVLLPSHLTALR